MKSEKAVVIGIVFAFAILTSVCVCCANGTPPEEEWNKTFDGSFSDSVASSVQQTSDGGYILAEGALWEITPDYRNARLVKTDSGGNKQWDKTLGGTSFLGSYSVQQTTDGGYILAGFDDNGAWLVKTDTNGNKQWDKIFGGTGDGEVYSVQQTTDGGYILAGSRRVFVGDHLLGSGAWLVKTDTNGNKQWDKTFCRTYDDLAVAVQQTTDGGYILAGLASYDVACDTTWLVKTDTNGNKQWDKTFEGTGCGGADSVQQTTDGGYVLAGFAGYDAWLVKTDTNGNKQWDKTFGDTGYCGAANSVQQTTDGGYILAGITSSYGAGDWDAWLVKTDTNGNKQWDKTFGGTGKDLGSSVKQTTDGGYILAGGTKGDLWLIKLKGKLPDLTLSPEDISFSNPTPAAGETITITATIHNIGNADANDVIVQFYSIDGSKIQIGSDYTIDSISASSGFGSATTDWVVTSDTQNIRVIIDPPLESGGLILEENEDNNWAGIINTGYRPLENGFWFSNYPYDLLPSWVPIDLSVGAHCLGMSVTSLTYYNHGWPLPEGGTDCNPSSGIPPCYQPVSSVWIPPCLTRCLIEYNQMLFYLDAARNNGMMQLLSGIVGKDKYVTLQYANLVSQLRSGPKMLILPGHAVVAYKIRYSNNQELIYIYDSHYPGSECKIILDVTDEGLLHMNPYSSGGENYEVFKVYEGPDTWFESVPLSIIATCPVDLSIIDPEGFTINKQSTEILGAIYTETNINGDGNLDDIIVIPNQKIGDYTITVIPESDAKPLDTYTLRVSAGDTTIVLAEDIPISDIPDQPYVIESTKTGIIDKTGFEPIPEFATIAIPVAAILGLVFLFRRRRHKE